MLSSIEFVSLLENFPAIALLVIVEVLSTIKSVVIRNSLGIKHFIVPKTSIVTGTYIESRLLSPIEFLRFPIVDRRVKI